MNEPSNPQNETGASNSPSPDSASPEAKSQPNSPRSVLESIGTAVHRGVEDAKRTAEQAMPKIKSAAADAAYWASYGVAFAAAFQWTLAKRLTPESVKTGWREGVKAGCERADKWADQLKRREENAAAAAPQPEDPSAGTDQASPA